MRVYGRQMGPAAHILHSTASTPYPLRSCIPNPHLHLQEFLDATGAARAAAPGLPGLYLMYEEHLTHTGGPGRGAAGGWGGRGR